MPTKPTIGGKIQPDALRPAFDVGPQAGMPVSGMLAQGNIDVNHRPGITNADGTHSSIFSMTVPLNKDGSVWSGAYERAPSYALVPSIANGKFLTPDGKKPDENNKQQMSQLEDAATQYYAKTRQQLGIFSSGNAADSYAGATHAYMNDGAPNKVFSPSPEVAGATGQNGYPPAPPSPPLPPALRGAAAPSGQNLAGLLKSLLSRP
jgi:hypothetical protein